MQAFDTIIIGSGCAGFNTADWLHKLGHRNIALITEGINKGTSRNTGSDKQTYYKLSLASDGSDSVFQMAESLFSGGGIHGDHALIEAACSVKCFMKLALIGVPFPHNAYGEYVGYKTDHDPRQRATSCGPLTSKLMTEALERSVNENKITILDNLQVIRILVRNNSIAGIAAIDLNSFHCHTYICKNVVLATGGPAGTYAQSVYPESQTGGTGLALEAGAVAQNLSEWQYGIASVKFRWNVSGTYQQVIPRYISVSPDGKEREFLYESLKDDANDMVFLKGYQWPFDVRKIDGSSRVDILVYEEIRKGNRVYMDFRTNPVNLDFQRLMPEAHQYLHNSNALFGTPIERLERMNPQAVTLYRNNGIDLYCEALEVAVCSQHCNGGIAVDTNWETSVKGLYAVGEAAGIFGVYRPGGSALNDTQVGSMRAAEHIAASKRKYEKPIDFTLPTICSGERYTEILAWAQKQMSIHAAFIRNVDDMVRLKNDIQQMLGRIGVPAPQELPYYYKAKDLLLTQIQMLSAMITSSTSFGSRGSALTNVSGTNDMSKLVITDKAVSHISTVRPLPEGGGWFENVWREYERNKTKVDSVHNPRN